MNIRGVIFDMDGTVVDVSYDWGQIKEELETHGEPILHFLKELEEPERSRKWRILERYEEEATRKAILKEGIEEFLLFLSGKKIKVALVTNNSRKNVDYLLQKFNLTFDCIISRESGLWKPSGAPFKAVMRSLRLRRGECCVVGDSPFDIQAAREAGISKVFIINKDRDRFDRTQAEVFSSVGELHERVEKLLRDSG